MGRKKYSRRYASKVAKENTTSWARDMELAGYGKPKRKAFRKRQKATKRDQMKWNKIMKGQGSFPKLFRGRSEVVIKGQGSFPKLFRGRR